MDALYAEFNKSLEAATSRYSVTGNFLHYIFSVLVAKNHQGIRSRCIVHEFSFADIFNDINHGSYTKEKFFVAASALYGCSCLLLL